MQHLSDEVTMANTVMASAGTLIAGLSARLRDIADNADAVNALAAELDANSAALGKAVSDGTPAAVPAPVDAPAAPVAP